jgi:predicted transcriptional regulator
MQSRHKKCASKKLLRSEKTNTIMGIVSKTPEKGTDVSETNAGRDSSDLLALTTDIVAAYVRANPIAPADLSRVIATVHASLKQLVGSQPAAAQKPAVPIKKSVMPDYLICLEDGKKLKMLKRHLRTAYGMTPEQYRAKWGLPPDYPMVAPNYAKQRSDFAKEIGLGRKAENGRRRT